MGAGKEGAGARMRIARAWAQAGAGGTIDAVIEAPGVTGTDATAVRETIGGPEATGRPTIAAAGGVAAADTTRTARRVNGIPTGGRANGIPTASRANGIPTASRSPTRDRRGYAERPDRPDRHDHERARDAPRAPTMADAVPAEELTPEQIAQMMGFDNFGSSKGQPVEDNLDGYAEVRKERSWRQYMNRKGGFNRPLDKV
ncbi:hypothetical protein MSPP1_001678 [Malassezia sp. CBS 17886]|nr:hypothetical protein MSPP1_001678 [Malassezia sp. CBS 17886]